MQLGLLLDTAAPQLNACELTIFAADHGIVNAGVSAYPQEVTRQMVLNFLGGGAAANVFARANGVDLRVVDAGVAGDALQHPELIDRRVAAGTADSTVQPAMTEQQLTSSMSAGREIVAESGADVHCFGEMGIGNTSTATLLLHKLLGLSVTELVGRGTGLDDEGLANKQAILERASERTVDSLEPMAVLAEYGGFEIAMMTGAILECGAIRKPVIVDGFIATSAAAAAIAIEPEVRSALIFAHCSAERGHRAALQALNVDPLFDMEMRLGEGTGALLAWPFVKCAAAMLADMASFDDAGVSGPA